MKIQVLGVGCPSCHKLFEMTKQAVKELKLNDEVEYIDDMQKIVAMGVLQVPVLAVDGKALLSGVVSDIEKIKNALAGEKIIGNKEGGCSCGGKC